MGCAGDSVLSKIANTMADHGVGEGDIRRYIKDYAQARASREAAKAQAEASRAAYERAQAMAMNNAVHPPMISSTGSTQGSGTFGNTYGGNWGGNTFQTSYTFPAQTEVQELFYPFIKNTSIVRIATQKGKTTIQLIDGTCRDCMSEREAGELLACITGLKEDSYMFNDKALVEFMLLEKSLR